MERVEDLLLDDKDR